jgi:hypothetical protein
MKIIIINGYPETGKDKFVNYFREISNYRVKNISSVDKVKMIAEICFNWNGKKDDKSRKFLSNIKEAWSEYNDGPTTYMINKIESDIKYVINNNKDINKNIYFLHIREPNEIKKIKKYFDKNNYDIITLIIKKDRDNIPENNSDKNVNNYKYDYTILNNGTELELKQKSIDFFNEISYSKKITSKKNKKK